MEDAANHNDALSEGKAKKRTRKLKKQDSCGNDDQSSSTSGKSVTVPIMKDLLRMQGTKTRAKKTKTSK